MKFSFVANRGLAWLPLAMVACILGCAENPATTTQSSRDLKLLDHERPPHWPADLAIALTSLQAYRASLANHSGEQAAGAAIAELTDVAAWLPEVAADTDLDERTWNEIVAPARALQRALARRPKGEAADGATVEKVLPDLDALIKAMEPIVAGGAWRRFGANASGSDESATENSRNEEVLTP